MFPKSGGLERIFIDDNSIYSLRYSPSCLEVNISTDIMLEAYCYSHLVSF